MISIVAGGTGRTPMCRDDSGRSVVLKLTPELEIAAAEAAALRAAAENTPLDQIAEMFRQLHIARPLDGFPTLADRVTGLFDLAERRHLDSPAAEHLPAALLHRSPAAGAELAADGAKILVHGDLHPGNVLEGETGIVAIDPRPCVGDPTFDAVDWAFLPVAGGGTVDNGIAALG